MQVLRQLSAEIPFEIFLARLERQETSKCDPQGFRSPPYGSWAGYDSDEEDGEDEGGENMCEEEETHATDGVEEVKLNIKELADLEGTILGSNITFSENDLTVDLDAFFDGVPGEEEYLDHDDHGECCQRTCSTAVSFLTYGGFGARCSQYLPGSCASSAILGCQLPG